jgi:putative inorganic carbon (HCO3(-)) transporter
MRVRERNEAGVPSVIAWCVAIDMLLWVAVPEVRRLLDWERGFNSLSVINLLPLLFLVPLALVATFDGSLARLHGTLRALVFVWLLSFGYGLLVAILGGTLLGGVYDFAGFVLPVALGVVLATRVSNAEAAFAYFSRIMLWLAVATSLYAIYQYISPPPWDVYWVNNSGLVSIGVPEPFGLRVFGTLNSPVTLADFLVVAILLTLPRLRLRRWPVLLALVPCIAALMLTFVRASWLELLAGFAVYVLFSPTRRQALAAAAFVAAAFLTAFAATSSLGNTVMAQRVQERLQTFADLQHDDSVQWRQHEADVSLEQARMDPLGEGLGTVGTATKLGNTESATTSDSGYLERLDEMGIIGFAGYLAVLAIGLAATLRRLMSGKADAGTAAVLAAVLALQVALAGLDLSSDHHVALMGVVFWCCVALVLQLCPVADALERAHPRPHVLAGGSAG